MPKPSNPALSKPLAQARADIRAFLGLQRDLGLTRPQSSGDRAFRRFHRSFAAAQGSVERALERDFSGALLLFPELFEGMDSPALIGQLTAPAGLLPLRSVWRAAFPGRALPAMDRAAWTPSNLSVSWRLRFRSAMERWLPGRSRAAQARLARDLDCLANPDSPFWPAWLGARDREAQWFGAASATFPTDASLQTAQMLGQLWARCSGHSALSESFARLLALSSIAGSRSHGSEPELFGRHVAAAAAAEGVALDPSALGLCSADFCLGVASVGAVSAPAREAALGIVDAELESGAPAPFMLKLAAFCWLRLDRAALERFEAVKPGFRLESLAQLRLWSAADEQRVGPWSMHSLAASLRSESGAWARPFFEAQSFDSDMLCGHGEPAPISFAARRSDAGQSYFQSAFNLSDTLRLRDAQTFLALHAANAHLESDDLYSAVLQSWKIGARSPLNLARKPQRL